ncbi:MAG: MFS transporter [Austwickia sp.]|nr:MAG: MFS transporter [Austwickia sp.]
MRAGPTFSSLAERNYRLFFAGALASNAGTWMARTAQSWLVLVELTEHSSSALGYVTAAQFLPMLVLAPWAGLIADRFAKRRVLVVTQLGMGLMQGLLAVLTLAHVVTLPQVYVLSFLTGAFAAVDAPARQAFVSEVVGPDLLPNAVGLNSANFNAARLIGPALAGLLIAVVGTGWVLAINALSYVAIIVSLTRMDPRRLFPSPAARGKGQIREGIAYVAARGDILLILAIVFLQGTFGMNFQMTTALMATTVFHKGPGEFGLLGSIMAVGSLTAALLVARRQNPRLRTVLVALAAFAVTMVAAALAPTYEAFAVLLIPVGLAAMTILPTCNSLVQLSVEPEMRGRVMAIYLAIFMGGTPLGSPLLGWIGDAWGARWTLLVGAAAALLALAGSLGYLVGYRGVRVRYRRGQSPHLVVAARPARPIPPPEPLPEITQ